MSKKNGRPRKETIQEKYVGFFVTRIQYFVIQDKVAQSGLNLSDYMRKMAVSGQVVARWQPEDRELFKKLVGIANDIQRLVKTAQEQNVLKAMLYFEEYGRVMDEVIKKLNHE